MNDEGGVAGMGAMAAGVSPWLSGGIGLGVGALKHILFDGPAAARKRKEAAETARYSPWTGMKPEPVQEADPFGSALSFGVTGAGMAQNMNDQAARQAMSDQQNKLVDAQTRYYDRALQSEAPVMGNVPWLSMGFPGQRTRTF